MLRFLHSATAARDKVSEKNVAHLRQHLPPGEKCPFICRQWYLMIHVQPLPRDIQHATTHTNSLLHSHWQAHTSLEHRPFFLACSASGDNVQAVRHHRPSNKWFTDVCVCVCAQGVPLVLFLRLQNTSSSAFFLRLNIKKKNTHYRLSHS